MARMRSLRLDDDLDDRLQQAASLERCSVSEFLRRAAAQRVEEALEDQRPSERMADVIGVVRTDGDLARDTGKAFEELLAEDHARHRRR